MIWTITHPQFTPDGLGYLPVIIRGDDPRPAKEQINDRYAHGGGWNPFPGFTMTEGTLRYSDDPPLRLLAVARLRDETLRFYECSWLAIEQPDGSFEVSRMD